MREQFLSRGCVSSPAQPCPTPAGGKCHSSSHRDGIMEQMVPVIPARSSCDLPAPLPAQGQEPSALGNSGGNPRLSTAPGTLSHCPLGCPTVPALTQPRSQAGTREAAIIPGMDGHLPCPDSCWTHPNNTNPPKISPEQPQSSQPWQCPGPGWRGWSNPREGDPTTAGLGRALRPFQT